MRKYYLIILFIAVFSLLLGKSYHVRDFNSTIDVNIDGTLNIEESMSYQLTGGPFRWVSRDVRAPKRGFILLEEAFIDGKNTRRGSQANTISIKNSNHLKVKFNLADISDQLVKFTLKYKVYNAFVTKGEKAVLEWTPLPDRYKFLIEKGRVTFRFPATIPISNIVNFLDEVEGVTYQEEDNSLICSFKNLKGKSFEVVSNLPKEEMQLKEFVSPNKEPSLSEKFPHYNSYIRLYKYLILALILFLIYVIFILIIRYDKQIKNLPEISKLPSQKHPALVARVLQVGSDDLNLIPVLMHMAIKQLISFTQVTNKKGKPIKDYYVDISSNISNADDIDRAYLELLRKEEARKKKRIELKSLVSNSYRYKKEVLKVLNAKFDETGFVDVGKKKKYYKKVIFFFVLLILGVVSSILGGIFFTKGIAVAPIPAFVIMAYWVYMMLHLDDKVILSPLGYKKWQEWKAFRNYINKALKNKAEELDPHDSEDLFPYILIMGFGQQYLRYFKKKNIELNFPNLGEIADDIEALNTLITVVVVTSATSGGTSAASGGGGGGASAG